MFPPLGTWPGLRMAIFHVGAAPQRWNPSAARDKVQIAGTVSIFSRLLPVNSCRSAAMAFSTTSYIAGVGSVVAALTIGFSGGFFLAKPTPYVEQNRLQRVTSSAPIASSAPQTVALSTPATIESKATSPAAQPASPQAQAAVPVQQPAQPEAIPTMAKADVPEPAQAITRPEPARAAVEQDHAAQSNVNAERLRASDAKAAARKRDESRKFAERRKQREIELATVAVRRMLRDRDRDPQQVADGIETPRETPRFGFFGQD
jgi:hypothetical protein